jgi:hypothetical protein
MKPVILTCCVLAVLAFLPAPAVRGVLATAAASLFEATPFILAGAFAQTVVSRFGAGLIPYLGCGCGIGPSARSLPATLATSLAFGPIPAVLRFAAATLSSRFLHVQRSAPPSHPSHHRPNDAAILDQLAALIPPAILGGAIVHIFGDIRLERAPFLLQWLGGAVFGFAASPCALGTVALAASLHVRAPAVAAGILCVSGIVDIRALTGASHESLADDVLSYILLGAATAIVASHRGDALVHPFFTVPLALCASFALIIAFTNRQKRCARARLAPVLMLAGAVMTAPAPTYSATETTLTSLFPGENIDFIGTLVHGSTADALVRFAITCCRADAAPVVMRLARRVHERSGTWLRADGTVEREHNELALDVSRVLAIAPPADPFIYR